MLMHFPVLINFYFWIRLLRVQVQLRTEDEDTLKIYRMIKRSNTVQYVYLTDAIISLVFIQIQRYMTVGEIEYLDLVVSATILVTTMVFIILSLCYFMDVN